MTLIDLTSSVNSNVSIPNQIESKKLIVWGDYGKKDRKSLMGIVQIKIDDIDITNLVIGWYRMFNAPSMAHSLVSSKALRHQLLSKTLDTD